MIQSARSIYATRRFQCARPQSADLRECTDMPFLVCPASHQGDLPGVISQWGLNPMESVGGTSAIRSGWGVLPQGSLLLHMFWTCGCLCSSYCQTSYQGAKQRPASSYWLNPMESSSGTTSIRSGWGDITPGQPLLAHVLDMWVPLL